MVGCMILLSHGLDAAVHLAGLGDYGTLGLLRDLFKDAGAAELAAAGVLVGVGVGMMEEMLFLHPDGARRTKAQRAESWPRPSSSGGAHGRGAGPMAVLSGCTSGRSPEWTGSIRPRFRRANNCSTPPWRSSPFTSYVSPPSRRGLAIGAIRSRLAPPAGRGRAGAGRQDPSLRSPPD
jgi:hypothetical protein